MKKKKAVVDLARKLVRQSNSRSRDPVLRETAKTWSFSGNRSLDHKEHDRLYPEKPVFVRPFGRLNTRERATLYKLYQQKVGYRQLMERFGLSSSSIHRIINHHRAKELFAS